MRWTSRDIVLVKGLLRIEAVDHLVDRCGRVKCTRATVEAHLGYPAVEMTGADYDRLEAWLERAEAAQRDRKPIPKLLPAPKKAP